MNTLHSLFDRLRRDRGGNFGIMTAILLPVLVGAAGVSIQVTDMLLSKQQLQEAADAAALATATALANKTIQPAQAEGFARDFVAGQMANYLQDTDPSTTNIKNSTAVNVSTTTSGKSVSYQVTVNPNYTINLNPMMRVIGFKTQNITASGTTVSGHSETQGSVSMYLVLDRSGSMAEYTTTVNASQPTKDEDCSYTDPQTNKKVKQTCTVTNYYAKIEALKLAVSSLAGQLNTADPDNSYVRTGSVSYNDKMQTAQALDWGTTKVVNYVNDLTATGRTDSSAAFKKAYDSLMDAKEDQAHQGKTGQTPTKYIVFMTDGDNNISSADTLTKKSCDDARQAKIQVYTIAFMAPAGGKALLSYCATTPAHYFAAENMTALLDAFKSIGAKAANQMTRLTN